MVKKLLTSYLLWTATSCASASPILPTNTSLSRIQWSNCSSAETPNLECGTFQVPLDWTQPDGLQITLGMNRILANNQKKKIGTLFFNPGGPGVPATGECEASAAAFGQRISDTLLEHFDLFCPDPRGVGTSGSIKCDSTLYVQRPSLYPQTETAYNDLIASNQAIGESCLNMTGPLLNHIDTISVARDMEALRIALGNEPMNYLGLSYGTMLGATYAELFPQNIRAMTLDGNWDHSVSPVEGVHIDSSTYSNVLQIFFAWCTANPDTCGFQSVDMAQSFRDLVERANKSPIPAPGCMPDADTTSAGGCMLTVTGDDIRSNVQTLLFLQGGLPLPPTSTFPVIGTGLNQSIVSHNATLFSNALPNPYDDPLTATAISCLDWIASVTPVKDTTKAFAELYEKQKLGYLFHPTVGSTSKSYENQASCLGWPAPVVNPQHALDPVAMAQLPPVLLVQSTHDPATSYALALRRKEQIPSAVLLTRDGIGHTSYFLGGEARAYVDSYLVNKTLPAIGTVVYS